jgi:hypothetical protein
MKCKKIKIVPEPVITDATTKERNIYIEYVMKQYNVCTNKWQKQLNKAWILNCQEVEHDLYLASGYPLLEGNTNELYKDENGNEAYVKLIYSTPKEERYNTFQNEVPVPRSIPNKLKEEPNVRYCE